MQFFTVQPILMRSMMKRLTMTALSSLFILVHSVSASDEDTKCRKMIVNSCTKCHTEFNVCRNLGIPEVYWKKKIKLMRSVGASISPEQEKEIISCLLKPDGIDEICEKE